MTTGTATPAVLGIHRRTRLPWIALGALAMVVLAVRVIFAAAVPDVPDSLLFIRGVERFSVAEMRPHWPGYPVYIALGKLFAALVGDATLGLRLVSVLASVATVVPLAFVADRWAASLGADPARAGWCGAAAGALWAASPASWITAGAILSDALGLLVAAFVLATAVAADGGRRRPALGCAVLVGVLVGIRLTNVTLVGPALLMAWRLRAVRWRRVPAPLPLAGAALLGALPWAAWLWWREGPALLGLGETHVVGHFTQWGNAAWTDAALATRPARFVRTLLVYDLGGGSPGLSWIRALATVGWVVIVAAPLALRPWRTDLARLVAAWAVPHLCYVVIAHNVGNPRYLLAAVALCSVWASLAAVRRGPLGLMLPATVALMLAVSVPLGARLRREPPVEYRAACFIARRHPRAAVLVGDDVSLLRPFLAAYAPGAEAAPADVAPSLVTWWRDQGRSVLATEPGGLVPGDWTPVARFCRDPLLDAWMLRELWLFEQRAGLSAGPVLECQAWQAGGGCPLSR